MPKKEPDFSSLKCPKCGIKDGVEVKNEINEIPYLGEVMRTTFLCEKCGYRKNEINVLEEHPPKEYKHVVDSIEDLKVRIVKSNTSILEVPELGIKIEPGKASEGYISNLEGVLNRIEEVLISTKEHVKPEKSGKVEDLLEKLERIKEGKEKAQIIVKDPEGNSSILGEETEERKLEDEEIEELKLGKNGALV